MVAKKMKSLDINLSTCSTRALVKNEVAKFNPSITTLSIFKTSGNINIVDNNNINDQQQQRQQQQHEQQQGRNELFHYCLRELLQKIMTMENGNDPFCLQSLRITGGLIEIDQTEALLIFEFLKKTNTTFKRLEFVCFFHVRISIDAIAILEHPKKHGLILPDLLSISIAGKVMVVLEEAGRHHHQQLQNIAYCYSNNSDLYYSLSVEPKRRNNNNMILEPQAALEIVAFCQDFAAKVSHLRGSLDIIDVDLSLDSLKCILTNKNQTRVYRCSLYGKLDGEFLLLSDFFYCGITYCTIRGSFIADVGHAILIAQLLTIIKDQYVYFEFCDIHAELLSTMLAPIVAERNEDSNDDATSTFDLVQFGHCSFSVPSPEAESTRIVYPEFLEFKLTIVEHEWYCQSLSLDSFIGLHGSPITTTMELILGDYFPVTIKGLCIPKFTLDKTQTRAITAHLNKTKIEYLILDVVNDEVMKELFKCLETNTKVTQLFIGKYDNGLDASELSKLLQVSSRDSIYNSICNSSLTIMEIQNWNKNSYSSQLIEALNFFMDLKRIGFEKFLQLDLSTNNRLFPHVLTRAKNSPDGLFWTCQQVFSQVLRQSNLVDQKQKAIK